MNHTTLGYRRCLIDRRAHQGMTEAHPRAVDVYQARDFGRRERANAESLSSELTAGGDDLNDVVVVVCGGDEKKFARGHRESLSPRCERALEMVS